MQQALEQQSHPAPEERDLDPNVRQRRASDPESSVWVSASAGTGKTKVLTDRVLRLLLPHAEGKKGTEPHKILCLTFTKAGANEMALRINEVLGKWAVMNAEKLYQDLEKLTGTPPDDHMMDEARKLFAEVVDTPGGLKILTIHSFCQSVLGRFPLEAGLSPHFTVLDETLATEILGKAREYVLAKARMNIDTPEGQALHRMATEQNETQFMDLLKELCSERLQLSRLLPHPATAKAQAPKPSQPSPLRERDTELRFAVSKTLAKLGEGDKSSILHNSIFEMIGIKPEENEDQVLQCALQDSAFDKEGLKKAAEALSHGAKTDQGRSEKLYRFLSATEEERAAQFDRYRGIFLTQKNEPLARMASKGALEDDPQCESVLYAEAERILQIEDKIRAINCALATRDLLILGWAILQKYQSLKERQAVLDYDDLIGHTLKLLQNRETVPWVMYKLDGGIDHMLIDEAQDTNPEQWEIIAALAEEFFTGYSARDDVTRTVFTVGDEKQSIYSFQRAAPAEFQRMKAQFAKKITEAEQEWQDETLNISFRSTKSVLQLVDEVFSEPQIQDALGAQNVTHESFRRGQEGIVELWPLFKTPEAEKEEPWELPVAVKETVSGQALLATHIARTIGSWLENGEILKSHDRAIEPGDIMILVRTRSAFVNRMVRALKKRNIPVSGVDRMVLGEQLAIMDLLALAQFALLPDDDLTLACVLKTPLLDWTEDELYEVSTKRNASLWQAVRESGRPETVSFLEQLIAGGRIDHPYEFFSRLLQSPCPADETSGLRAIRIRLGDDALDPLDEFLNATLSFEKDHIPTLQGFLAWQQSNDITIKREMEKAGGHVRIMTVHGAKGLQAPIVILPDTTRTHSSKRMSRLLWPDKSGLAMPLWSPGATCDANIYNKARRNIEATLDEEYWRLLYVALTRAEDRLYIGGYEGRKSSIDESWYTYVSRAFERLEDVEEFPFKPSPHWGEGSDEGNIKSEIEDFRHVCPPHPTLSPRGEGFFSAFRLSNPQTKDPDRGKEEQGQDYREAIDKTEPKWLRRPSPPEADPPRPLVPSRPSEPEPAMQSPLAKEDQYRFRRGLVTHKLLQILPDIAPDKRLKAAEAFVSLPGHDLSDSVRRGIVSETMRILEHPEYSALFGPDSMAEVPVTGMVGNNRLISGQIDRLLVTDDAVWIVDYKTNRPPPQNEKDIPAQYRSQMRAYHEAIAAIYPDRDIKSFLLWTDGPTLMPVILE